MKPFLLDDVKSPSQLVFDSESDCFQLAAVFTSLIDVLKAKGLIDPSVKADIVIGFSGYPHAYTRIINKEKDEIVAYDGYIMPTKDFINWVQNDMKNSPTYDSEFGYILDPGDVRDTKQTRANNPRVPKLYSFNSSVSRKDHINYGLYLYMKKHYQDWTGKQMAPFQNMYQADPSMSLTALGQKVFEYWQSESPRNTYTIGDANAYAAIVLEDAGNTIPEIEEKKKWIEDAGAALKAATAGTPESQPLIIELGKNSMTKSSGIFTLDEIDSLLNLAYAFPVGNDDIPLLLSFVYFPADGILMKWLREWWVRQRIFKSTRRYRTVDIERAKGGGDEPDTAVPVIINRQTNLNIVNFLGNPVSRFIWDIIDMFPFGMLQVTEVGMNSRKRFGVKVRVIILRHL